MDRVTSARAIKFGGEIIVEVQGTDKQGAIDVITYQFDFGKDDQALIPKEPVVDEHVSIVRDSLVEDGLRWVTRGE